MNFDSLKNSREETDDNKYMDNISQSSSPHDNSMMIKEEEKNKLPNDSILSSSSSSCSSFSPNFYKNNPGVKLDWYKQYEESLKLFNHHRLAGFHSFMKPNQSSPISTNSQLNENSILMDRFYPQFPPSHQALLAHYAQIYGQNQFSSQFSTALTPQHNTEMLEKEKERLMQSGFGHQSNINFLNSNQRQELSPKNHKDDKRIRRNRGNSSCDSRSISPSSSQHSAQIDCEEDDENLADDSQSINAANGEWTYEEQFKQLYELSDDAKRKEFLDDLFSFMQKRGSPVNRIPIMAKHVLDLYELYRLVVSKGGLVEVINKKLWREITKGLNLPSSITSAAFTLRTQYMKYLYPYECEKLKMSTPNELQAAIDGNRREGRRPVYGYEYSSPNCSSVNSNLNNPNQTVQNTQNSPSQIPSIHHPHPLIPHPHQNHHHALLAAAAAAAAAAAHHHNHPLSHLHENNNLEQNNLNFQHHVSNHPNTPLLNPFIKNYFELNTPPSSTASNVSHASENSQNLSSSSSNNSSELDVNVQRSAIKRPFESIDSKSQEINSKKILLESNQNSKISEQQQSSQNSKMNIKISGKDFVDLDRSLTICFEFNGFTYQGTLHPTRLENNNGIQIQIPYSGEDAKKEINILKPDSNATTSSSSSIKTDIIF
ncbi:unnamed protein product [Brachionus calyciflorus]|uniref:ARID domain-containing protein n=1 Tax=Brachionus calyciflorus TaxID=104777 RepID=A0A813M5T9_9BILA|nr:unnamed protein product [Brachionus calyciflorus]